MKTVRLAAILCMTLVFAVASVPAKAALVTSISGGTVIDMVPVDSSYRGDGPITFGSGVTWTATYGDAVFGYDSGYGFGGNGYWNGLVMAGLNSASGSMTFSFENPVDAVGGFLNYAVPDVGTAIIGIYDELDNLIEETMLSFFTGGGLNSGYFFGFDLDSPLISYFKLSNAYIGIAHLTIGGQGDPTSIVPEPSTLLMLSLGLIGLAGVRRRRR